MTDEHRTVYVVHPALPAAGGEAAGAFVIMAALLWAYAIGHYVPDWSADVRIVVWAAGVAAFVYWIRYVVVLVLAGLAALLLWYRL